MNAARSDLNLEALRAQKRRPGEASYFYHDPNFQFNAVKVLPGEYFVTEQDLLLVTVLGSCIAACIWDAQSQVGGMNHFMLPDGDSNGRYGSYAMELLINELLKKGAHRQTLQAKIFGGGQVMHSISSINVGERNTSFVLDYLRTEHIPVVSQDVMDIYPRKVCYFAQNGKAMVKRLAHTRTDTLATERKGDVTSWMRTTAGGSVDLF